MIGARHLTKRYGQTVAVDDACFAVRPGWVTGSLGPNEASKSQTLRLGCRGRPGLLEGQRGGPGHE